MSFLCFFTQSSCLPGIVDVLAHRLASMLNRLCTYCQEVQKA